MRAIAGPHRSIYSTRKWRKARGNALARADRRCQRCGTSDRLEVHHRRKLSEGGDPFAIANLEVMCVRCHRRAERQSAAPALGDEP